MHHGRLRLSAARDARQRDCGRQDARTSTACLQTYPYTTIRASGMDVGLPDGQMGNSEVGHTNIGAGRVVYQELTRITKSITDGDFFENDALAARPWTHGQATRQGRCT